MTRALRTFALTFSCLAGTLSIACGGSDNTNNLLPVPDSDSSLASLNVSAGTLSPAFASGTTRYALALPAGTTSFTVTAAATNAKALSVAVGQDNGALYSIDSGAASKPLTAPAGSATSAVKVRVTAQDNSITTYVITASTASAALSTDAALSSLATSAGALSPAFASGTMAYALSLPSGTASFTLTPVAHDSTAKSITVQAGSAAAATVASGSASAAIAAPAVGASTTVTVKVTAADGSTTGSYVVTVTQGPSVPSSDDALSALTLSVGALSPAFSAGAHAYSVVLPNGTSSFTVKPTAHESHATLTVKQDSGSAATVSSGSSSGGLTVPAVGVTSTLTIHVTAQDGTAQDTAITVTQAAPPANSFTVYAIGDSTMADYDPAVYPNQAGWGMELRQFIIAGTGFNYVNAARNGTSSKSFYNGGSWAAVKALLKSGDYVLIQFAHNDESAGGLEGPDGVSTAPFGAYQTYLTYYVNETRAVGAIPIFVTPVVRRNFSGATLTLAGQHDLTGTGDSSIPAAQDLNYVEAMKQVATTKTVPLIDLTAATKMLVEQFGPTDSKSIIYIAADDTHLQPLGATLFAQLAVQGFLAQGLFTGQLNASAELVASPTSLNFGTLFTGATFNKSLAVTGLSLSPAAGNVTVTAPAGFAVSATATGTFASTLTLPYTGGRLSPTDIFVQFQPTMAQVYSGTVTVTPPSGDAQSVAVTGTAMAATGGSEAIATYALQVDPSCVATGSATCAAETFSGIYDKMYSVPAGTTWSPTTPANIAAQCLSILGDSWAGGEVGPVPGRYAQFAVSPAAGTTWTVDSISLFAGGAGGSNMGYEIDYSTDPTFSAQTPLLSSTSNAKNAMILQSFAPVLTVTSGETLYLRVYPWLQKAAAAGKYVCIQDLVIHGTSK